MASSFSGAVFDVATVEVKHATIEREGMHDIRVLYLYFFDANGDSIGSWSAHGASSTEPIALRFKES